MSAEPFGKIVDLGAFLKADLEKLTAAEVKQAHIAVAHQLKAEVIADATVKPRVTTIVDGRSGASEESVKPYGVIAYRFQYWAEVLKETIAFARSISPVLSGLYRDSWFALADGVLVSDPNNPPDAREYIVTNDQPYARVIEVGKKGKKFRAGVHVAEKTAKAMQMRFGNSVAFQVRFLDLAGAGSGRAPVVPWVTKRGQHVTYPSIVLRPL
jgi:hypothetical protein